MHCKDTILRTQNNWPYSKLIPNSGSILTREQIEYMMEWMYSYENLHRQMENEGHVFFLACDADEALGYVSVRQETDDLFHLEKIYIKPCCQKMHLGKKLFERAISAIKEVHPEPCRMELNVNRQNPALGFYEHMGMELSLIHI